MASYKINRFICFLDNSPINKQKVRFELAPILVCYSFYIFMGYFMGYFTPLNIKFDLGTTLNFTQFCNFFFVPFSQYCFSNLCLCYL